MNRCSNCGYANPEDARNCGNCELALNVANPHLPYNHPNPMDGGGGGKGKKTQKGALPNMPFWDSNETPVTPPVNPPIVPPVDQPNLNCPKCAYPLVRQDMNCPNCGSSLQNPLIQQKQVVVPPVLQNVDKKRTIAITDFSGFDDKTPKCKLVAEKDNKEWLFEGEQIQINREIIDPKNATISSENHLIIEYKEGKWYIEDASSNGATFVQVCKKMEIQSGTILVIGNKMLKFVQE